MSLIGVLTESQNKAYLKEELEKRKVGKVFFLTEDTVQNMHNVKFDVFLLGKKVIAKQETVREMAKSAEYFILNSDIKENLQLLENLDLKIITYGYNQKATVTASSVQENNMMICLQRGITNVYGEKIEPQEIVLKIEESVNDSAILELTSLLFLYTKKT